MLAALKRQMEVCLKLAELGADLTDLNKASWVRETYCNCISVYHCRVHLLFL